MAANNLPIYPGTIRSEGIDVVKDAAAVDLWAAGADGSRIDKITVKTTTAGSLTLSRTDGTVTMELDAIGISAGEVVDIMTADLPWKDGAGAAFMATGWTLKVSADQDMTIIADGGDF